MMRSILVWLLLVTPAAADVPVLTPARREALALQVRLDRAHFSPGEIDGRLGPLSQSGARL